MGTRLGRAFDAAGGLSRFRVEEHGKQGDSAFVVLAPSAQVTHPGREVWDRDEFFTQPREVGDMTTVHDACRAFIARYGTTCEL